MYIFSCSISDVNYLSRNTHTRQQNSLTPPEIPVFGELTREISIKFHLDFFSLLFPVSVAEIMWEGDEK